MWMNFIVHVAMAIALLVSHERVLQFRYEEVTRYTHTHRVCLTQVPVWAEQEEVGYTQ